MYTVFKIAHCFTLAKLGELKDFIHREWILDRVKYKLEFLEYDLTKKGEWDTSISTLIKILKCLDNRLLENVPLIDANNVKITTGFKNSKHVLDWASVVRNNIHGDVRLGDESRDIAYNRRELTLYYFLMHNGKPDTTLVGFKQQLLNLLENMQIELKGISNPRIREREESIINTATRDLFSIVEGLIALGVNHE